jgi:hypothetical protein
MYSVLAPYSLLPYLLPLPTGMNPSPRQNLLHFLFPDFVKEKK